MHSVSIGLCDAVIRDTHCAYAYDAACMHTSEHCLCVSFFCVHGTRCFFLRPYVVVGKKFHVYDLVWQNYFKV